MSPAQRIHKKKIIRSGGLHYVPRTFDEFTNIVEKLLEDENE